MAVVDERGDARPGAVAGVGPGGSDAGLGRDSNGQVRRRNRTHEALLAAGRQLVARGAEDASIEEITRLAGVGFGSFTNHFPDGKADFFHQAALGLLSQLGGQIGAATAGEQDPVMAVAVGFRTTARLARSEAAMRAVLLRPGTDVLFAAETLWSAAQHDILRGQAAGQFVAADPQLLLVGVGSVLIGCLRLLDVGPDLLPSARRDEVGVIDDACAAALRLLGVDADRAQQASRAVMPQA